MGAAIFAGAGLFGAVALVWFFISASALTRLAERQGRAEAGKGGRRDWRQVLANGSVAAAMAVLFGLGQGWAGAAMVGALAAANADTWATEIGLLVGGRPRLLTTWRDVAPGTSGGVTLAGLFGTLLGGLSLGIAAAATSPLAPGLLRPDRLPALALVAGLAGSLFDSLLGAAAQERRFCPACGVAAEHRRHPCGTPTRRQGGLPGLDNDGVNLAATALGALLGAWLAG